MKTKIFAVLVAVMVMFYAFGCAGKREAFLKTQNEEPVVHKDTNLSLLQPSVGPVELAEAYRIKKQADTLDKMMTGLQNGKTVTAPGGKFLIGLINNDSSRSVYVYHPEMPGMKMTAQPRGGFQILEVRDIPYEITLYYMNGAIMKKVTPRYEPYYQEKVAHKKQVGNVLVDYIIEVNKIY